jgi:hypothetical protein
MRIRHLLALLAMLFGPSVFAQVVTSSTAVVTVTGSGFVQGSVIVQGGMPCANTQFVSATQLTAACPSSSGTITVTNPETCVNATANTWANSSIAPQATSFRIQFDASSPTAGQVFSVGVSPGPATKYSDLTATVGWSSGKITARNLTSYVASSVAYTPGTTYHFVLDVNLAAHNYSASVAVGGVQTSIASNFLFESQQSTVISLANVGVFATSGTASVCNIAVSQSSSSHKVQLSWSSGSPAGMNGFSVKRSVANGSGYATVASVSNGTSYVDTSVNGATTYYYVVTALSPTCPATPTCGESGNSNQFTAVVPGP